MTTVAIIGAGFSGTMIAVHLLRRAAAGEPTPGRILLFERTGRFTAGVAYGTFDPKHVLNVPAGRMSAFDDDPDSFLRFCRERDPRIHGGSFVARPLYGEYLAALLQDAEAKAAAAGARTRLERIPAEVADVAPGAGGASPWQVRTRGGLAFEADDVVLAVGNFAPACPIKDADARDLRARGLYAPDPWAIDALDVARDRDILLIGTGLTMLDMAVTLHGRKHVGTVYAVSRRGLVPHAHRVSAVHPPHHPRPQGLDAWPPTARGLLRALRVEVDRASDQGVDWREVVTSIRHDTQALWHSLPRPEKARFLRHVRPYWETHRHRASPETAAIIDEMVGSGSLRVIAGRIAGVRGEGESAAVTIRLRGGDGTQTLSVARIVNCTGPDTNLARVEEPLIRAMLDRGLIRPDDLSLGLDSDESGAIISRDGATQRGLHLVGPLRKGLLWENTAVPELRTEAARMAAKLAIGAVSARTAPARVLQT